MELPIILVTPFFIRKVIFMNKVSVKLLNTPQILIDDIPVIFPYKKAEALFYYLTIKKTITRDEAVALLWEDNEESIAKKNLRHALYVIKKKFGFDIISAPQKYKLILNPETNIEIDLDKFQTENRLDLYTGTLLKGFGVKNAYTFEEWLSKKQETTREIYLTKQFELLKSIPYHNLTDIEQYSNRYILEDPLDERIYLFLMETYKENKLYHKGIKVYQKLMEILNDELGISPNKEITNLYHELLNLWLDNSSEEIDNEILSESIRTRKYELSQIHLYYNKFLAGELHNIMVMGENGIGKTHLINTFLSDIDKSNFLILQTSCLQAEKEFPLQPWNNLILNLEEYINNNNIALSANLIYTIAQLFPCFGALEEVTDIISRGYSYNACKSGVVKLFQIVAKSTKILLFIDNIHSMDKSSLDLLSSIMRMHNPNIMVISTCLDVVDYNVVTFTSTMVKDELLHQIPMSRLTKEEALQFINATLEGNNFDEETLNKIYTETDGNIFFLLELLNNMKSNDNPNELSLNAQGILNDRLNGISTESRQLLDIISLFHDFANLSTFSVLQNKNQLEILDLLDELKEHALIIERNDNGRVYFTFTHTKMREFVYHKLSPSKQRILHNRVGEVLEQSNDTDLITRYKRLIYHYTLGENEERVLYYKILYTEKYSSTFFELYPVLDNKIEENLFDAESVVSYFNNFESELNNYKRSNKNFVLFDELEARILHAKSNYCIQEGFYEEGLECIRRALNNTYVIKHSNLYLQILRQEIYYSIQVCDTDLMDKCTKNGLELSLTSQNDIEHAIYNRLRGLFYIMTGKYRLAIASLIKSIDFLEKANLSMKIYTLNIAAAYNYLGELHRKQNHFKEAMSYYNKAISITEENNCPKNPTFLANLGRTYFDHKDYEKSFECFKQAKEIYLNSAIIVGKATTMAYTALYTCYDGNFSLSEAYILEAERIAETLKSPLEKGILKYIQHIIATNFKGKLMILDKPAQYYKDECKKYFEPFNETYILQEIMI